MINDGTAARPTGSGQNAVNLGVVATRGPNGGAQVAELQRFGSAAKAGIQVGDEITHCNNQKIVSMEQWNRDLERISP